nr:tRNA 4-thiouridine(8) synthase ThiI [Oscillospiraceae bacterium]
MNDIILCKLGEMILKGLNRRSFEQRLLTNIKKRLDHIGSFRVYCLQSTVYVEGNDGADMDAAFEALKKIFGIIKLERAAACEKDKDAIVALAREYLKDELHRAKSFKVESK